MGRIVLVCGGRDFSQKETLFNVLDTLHEQDIIERVVNGDARGADQLSSAWARSRNVNFVRYPANWDRDGYAAGPIRNQLMLNKEPVDVVIAFPGGKGTADMVRRSVKKGIKTANVTEAGELQWVSTL